MDLKRIGRFIPLAVLLICSACAPALSTAVVTSPATPQPETPADAPTPTSSPPVVAGETPTTSDAPLAALVNGRPIYLADYERELGQYEADLPTLKGLDPTSPEGKAELAQARAWILDFMITEKLIVQAAEEAGITISDEEVDAVMQDVIAENGGEEAFKEKLADRGETYEQHREKERRGLLVMKMNQHITEGVPKVAEHVHARHILVDTAEEAERIHAQLEGGADFAALARAYSQDPNTRDIGGDLDWFPRGILTVPEVEEAAFALQPGQFSDVIPSLLGYHIVQVVERDPARTVSEDNLRLLQERMLQGWIDGLKAKAEIEVFVDLSP